jgi:hypothetical protein
MPNVPFVLVHSPLVGPVTWAGVAAELRAGDVDAIVPSLVEATRRGQPAWRAQADAVADAAARAGFKRPVVVGHSGAGALLPVVGEALDGVGGYMFVDAGLPEGGGTRLASLHPSLRSHLENLEHDGMLPPWSEWWSRDTLERLVPDEPVRAAFVAELEPVPLRVFEETLPEVRGWPDAPCGYLRFSEAYEGEEADAAGLGWPVAHLRGSHLEMLLQPIAVAAALLQLAVRMRVGQS